MRRPAKADGEILLAAKQHDQIGLAQLRRGAVQPALEIAENIR